MVNTLTPVPPRRCPTCKCDLDPGVAGKCPQCNWVWEPVSRTPRPRLFSLPEMRYQNAYAWLVLFSSLDIMLTYVVLFHWGGFEANPVAAAIVYTRPFYYATVFKFALVTLAIILCEAIGRMNDRQGRKLSLLFVLIGAFPVVYTLSLLLNNPLPADIVAAG